MNRVKFLAVMALLISVLTACGGGASAQPTLSVPDIQTLAVAAFAAGLTETAQAAPTLTPSSTSAPTDTPAALNTFVAFNPSGSPLGTPALSPTVSCNGLVYLKDVSIPDNTQVPAGKKFTKSWLAQNTGGCPWQIGFKFTVVGGDPMGGSTLVLSQAVNPGDQFQLSVPMTAPSQAGKASGTWRMSDASGSFFGDPLTVVIVVVNKATETPSDTATPTP